MKSIGRNRRIVALTACGLMAAAPASAQRRGPPRAGAEPAAAMQAGIAAGAAGVDVRVRGSSWDVGPMFGARWSWSGTRSGALFSLDLQPFLASGGDPAGEYRAAWLLPAYEIRAGTARVRAGIGLGIMRFEEAFLGDRTDFTPVTAAGGTLPLPASLTLELVWRRTGIVRGFRSTIWSLQLARLWPL